MDFFCGEAMRFVLALAAGALFLPGLVSCGSAPAPAGQDPSLPTVGLGQRITVYTKGGHNLTGALVGIHPKARTLVLHSHCGNQVSSLFIQMDQIVALEVHEEEEEEEDPSGKRETVRAPGSP